MLNKAFPELVMGLMSAQVDVDIIDEEGICAAEVKDGALCIAGEAYRAVVLPPIDALDLATLRALGHFAQAGGILLAAGSLPRLAGSAQETLPLQELVKRLFGPAGQGQLTAPDELVSALQSRLAADLKLRQPNAAILYTHRWLEGRHIYFITNNLPQPAVIQPILRQPGPYTLYRPLDGSVTPLPTPLVVDLAGYEGIFVVTEA